MRRFRLLPMLLAPLALVLTLNLAACGNKGPLVRPSVEDVGDIEDYDAIEDSEDAAIDVPEADPEASDDAADDRDDPSLRPGAGNG